MIVLARSDDRLIHGQLMTVIVKQYKVDDIIVIDDFTANNPILKRVFNTAVPSNMKADVFTVKDAIPKIKAAMKDSTNTLLLMKSPEVYRDLIDQIDGLPKELNIGPMTNRRGSVEVNQAIHLMPKESEAVKEIADKGVHVYFRQVPGQPIIEWEDIKNKF